MGLEHHVVPKQVTMNRPTGQGAVGGERGDMVLVGQLALQQGRLFGRYKGQNYRHRFVPPIQRPQIGLLHAEISARKVHTGQHGAHLCAMCGGWRQLALATQPVDHGRRLALQDVHHIAIAVGGRVRHRNAVVGQMLHQPQIERQLFHAQPFKQGEYIRRFVGGDEVIGVFYATRATRHGLEGTQLQGLQEVSGLVKRDLCVNRHVCQPARKVRIPSTTRRSPAGREMDKQNVKPDCRVPVSLPGLSKVTRAP